MPTCEHCKKFFPNYLYISGKIRNLGGRKNCLKCSPFGSHRTRSVGFQSAIKKGFKICPRCKTNKPSIDFYKRRNGKDLSPYCKVCTHKECQDRLIKFKKEAVEYKGGKCTACGYNKYLGALEFHHINPKEKEFEISKLKTRSFNDITKKELDRCELLCSNCHKEKHALIIGDPDRI